MAPRQKYIHVQAPTATTNKRSALKVPLQTELRFHLRRYKQPHSIGGPAERQKTDERHAVARSSSGDDDDPHPGWPNCSSDGLRADAAATLPSPTPTLEGRGQVQRVGGPNTDGGGDPVGNGDFSSRLHLGTDDRGRQPSGRSPLRSSRTSGAPTSARRRHTGAKAGPPQNTNAALAARDILGGPPVHTARQPPSGRRGHREPSRRARRAEADDARRRPAPRCRSPTRPQGQ
jgi:hypothetical protein